MPIDRQIRLYIQLNLIHDIRNKMQPMGCDAQLAEQLSKMTYNPDDFRSFWFVILQLRSRSVHAALQVYV